MNNRKSSLVIEGLYIDKNTVEAKEQIFSYNIHLLKKLLSLHQNKIELKLIDDLYLDLNTIEVIDFQGKPYAIKNLES